MKRRDLFDVDLDLELTIEEFRRYCSRISHGRVTLTVDMHGGLVVDRDLEAGPTTHEDTARLMKERPHKEAIR